MEQAKGILVGLTGPTGAGKTMVSDLLKEKGFSVIDCDGVARYVVERGKKCLLELAIEFGIEILNADGTLNRRKLGDLVFRDKEKRKRLNDITFPHIQDEIFERVEALYRQGQRVIFLDAPTLFESGTDKNCDRIVSVVAPEEDRFLRILRRDNLTEEQIRNRMRSQHDRGYYTSRSDFVIDNDKDFTDLRVKVMEMIDVVTGMSVQETEESHAKQQ